MKICGTSQLKNLISLARTRFQYFYHERNTPEKFKSVKVLLQFLFPNFPFPISHSPIFALRHIFIILLSLAACLPPLSLSAQEPTVEAATDAAAILIGEQIHLTTRVTCGKNAKVKFPDFQRGYIVDGVEMLEVGNTDTLLTDGGRRMELTRV